MLAEILGADGIIVIVVVVAVLLFGGTKIPKLARGIGRRVPRVQEGTRGGRQGRSHHHSGGTTPTEA